MTNKQRAQASLLVEIDFKRKNAEHQIDEVRHSLDASAVPSPYLRADVVNYLLVARLFSQCARETQIETWVINEDDRVGFDLQNFLERLVKLFPEITIFPEYLPQTEDCRIADPIFELSAAADPSRRTAGGLAGDLLHLGAAAPDKLEFAVQLAQRTH